MGEDQDPSLAEMVLCVACSDAVASGHRCLTCGQPDPLVLASRTDELRDHELLDRVGVALAAQAALAVRVAGKRTAVASDLLAEGVVLQGRLRRQATLLRSQIAERQHLMPHLSDALREVNHAVDRGDRRRGTGKAWSLSARLPRDRSCSTVARRLLAEYVREELAEDERESVLLIASELATNAYQHGRGTIFLRVWRSSDRLRIEVRDDGRPARIEVVPEDERDAGGRGLWVVEQLASQWGAPAGTGHVWAELTVRTPTHTAG